MSAVSPAVYRFATPQQWSRCLLHRMDMDASLVAIRRLFSRAVPLGPDGPVSTVGLSPGGLPYARFDASASGTARLVHLVDDDRVVGPFEIDGSLASGDRWVVGRDSIWAFAPSSASVQRYDRDTLERDRSVDAGATILDAAPDGRDGVWLLLHRNGDQFELLHVDCRGCVGDRHPLPCEVCRPTRLGSVDRGRRLVLLTAEGRRLVFVESDRRAHAVDRDARAVLVRQIPGNRRAQPHCVVG
jgi:hypothetical protein